MGRGRHLRIGLKNRAVRSDYVTDALCGARVRGVASAVRQTELSFLVAEQREWEAEFLRERGIVGDAVEGDAEDLRPLLLELAVEVAEPAPFLRSTGCICPRVEPEHDTSAAVVGQPPRRPGVVRHGKVGRLIAGVQHATDDTPTKEGSHRGSVLESRAAVSTSPGTGGKSTSHPSFSKRRHSHSRAHLRNVPYACSPQRTRPRPPSKKPP
jgi:hypothetical protein